MKPLLAHTPKLDAAHVERLLGSRSSDVRAETAEGVGALLTAAALNEAETRIAIEIIEVLAGDVALKVREAVSRSVAHCTLLPPRIARQLAEDVESVALPILRVSDVFIDQDLVELVRRADRHGTGGSGWCFAGQRGSAGE